MLFFFCLFVVLPVGPLLVFPSTPTWGLASYFIFSLRRQGFGSYFTFSRAPPLEEPTGFPFQSQPRDNEDSKDPVKNNINNNNNNGSPSRNNEDTKDTNNNNGSFHCLCTGFPLHSPIQGTTKTTTTSSKTMKTSFLTKIILTTFIII